ncbi:MAG: response regulator transcription factor [Crocinitomicaceae bacterium]|nr:LytTR family DNA-binding domain-containing protein [Flavobacteriales bacterium]NQZ34111.1 response regulator transcription factor [Crocinitomicaceae bacterium]
MINYIIIDDEPIAHRIIEGYATNLPYLKKIGNCYNTFEAMQLFNKQSVDLIFLDINMPKLTGYEFLKTLVNPPKIIVTTAYKEYALEGYELNISDYLLKPFSFARFVSAINKVVPAAQETAPNVEVQETVKADTKATRIFIKGDKQHHQVDLTEILCIEAYGNYSKIHLHEETIISHEKISAFEILLPKNEFLRVHKSFIAAIAKIKRIEGNRIYFEERIIPIGQTYKSVVQQLLK